MSIYKNILQTKNRLKLPQPSKVIYEKLSTNTLLNGETQDFPLRQGTSQGYTLLTLQCCAGVSNQGNWATKINLKYQIEKEKAQLSLFVEDMILQI